MAFVTRRGTSRQGSLRTVGCPPGAGDRFRLLLAAVIGGLDAFKAKLVTPSSAPPWVVVRPSSISIIVCDKA